MKNSFLLIAVTLISTNLALAAPHGMYLTKNQKHARSIVEKDTALEETASEAKGMLKYYGGPVISNAKVYAVYWGNNVNATTKRDIGGFFSTVLNSTHMDWLNEYATNITAVNGQPGTNQTIGRGTFAGDITIAPSFTSNRIDDTNIQAELDKQITAGKLPKPDADSLYMIFFPPGTSITIQGMQSCQVFCAYHEGFKSNAHGNVFYGVMPDQGGTCAFGCGQESNAFDNLSAITAHELIEAITDPFPTPGNSPAFPQAWNTTDGSEIGDLCTGNNARVVSANRTYVVQQEFDNAINDCAAGPYKSP